MNNQSVYERITGNIIQKLQTGVIPWKASWKKAGMPKNAVTKKVYRGVNLILLAGEDYSSPYWMTYKQAKALGGSVITGEKGTPVLFWKWIEKIDEETKEESKVPMLKTYTVFNANQCEGITLDESLIEHETVPSCDEIVSKYLSRESGLTLTHKKGSPFYVPVVDTVNVPEIGSFNTPADYYHTLFHELVHSTGHETRLDRGLLKPSGFSLNEYSKEELVAELGASFLSGLTGIEEQTIEDSAGYIKGWISALENDPRLVIQASAQAQKAVDYIQGVSLENF